MPAKEERRIYGDAEDFRQRSRLHTSKKNIIIAGERACLSIVLFDDTGGTPIANTDYSIEGPDGTTYSGTTDDEGYLFHADVPIDDYELTIGNITVIVPVVLNEEERHLQRVIDYEIP
jgi:phosphatidate phosphatase APP1